MKAPNWGAGVCFALFALNCHAVTDDEGGPYGAFVLQARYSVALCSLDAGNALTVTRMNNYLNDFMEKSDENKPVDFEGTNNCILEQGKKLKLRYVDARKAAGKNTVLVRAINTLNETAVQGLLAVTPSSGDTNRSYPQRINATNNNLRSIGDALIATSCQSDIECIMSRSKAIRTLP